jgi:hypothetical protein
MSDRTAILVSISLGDINPAFSSEPDPDPNLQAPIALLLGKRSGCRES